MRDIIDHLLRVIELAEAYRETVSSLMELHLSTLSQKMNETMRFLAVISTVFIPLTFIAGVYGMNFDPGVSDFNMPELRSPIGYPVVLGGMLLLGIGLVFFFRRRGWLGGRESSKSGSSEGTARNETRDPTSGRP
jgi:magnesium transporter